MTTGISMSAFGAGSSGMLGVGIDVTSTVNALMALQRKPEDAMQSEVTSNNQMIAALQQISSQLQALSDSISDLGNFSTGSFSSVSASSSDSGVLTATATADAATGEHTVVVKQLATYSSVYAGPIAADAVLKNGTLSFSVGGATKTVTIDAGNNTLEKLATTINDDATLGVTARVLQGSNGATLALVSNTSGTAGQISITSGIYASTAQDGTGESDIQIEFTAGTSAQDAQLTVDGVPFSQSSNTLDNIIPGVSMELWSASPAQSVAMNIGPNAQTAAQGLQNFVSAYNAIITSINQQFTVNSGNAEGPLGNDAALKTLQSQLLAMISYQRDSSDSIRTLRSLGIEMNDDGTLSVESSTLSSALQNDYQQVKAFFQDTQTGFAMVGNQKMMDLTSPSTGLLAVDTQGLNNTNQDLARSIQDFETRLSTIQERLTDEYNKINAAMEQFPSLMQSISEQLSSLQAGK